MVLLHAIRALLPCISSCRAHVLRQPTTLHHAMPGHLLHLLLHLRCVCNAGLQLRLHRRHP
jgi:hypothetical protein